MTKKSRKASSTKTKQQIILKTLMLIIYQFKKKNHMVIKTLLLNYFIVYNDNDIIRPLSIRLPQMTGYARKFGEKATIFHSKR